MFAAVQQVEYGAIHLQFAAVECVKIADAKVSEDGLRLFPFRPRDKAFMVVADEVFPFYTVVFDAFVGEDIDTNRLLHCDIAAVLLIGQDIANR